jgi:hypothetical protein
MAEPSSQHVAAAEGGTVRASSHDIAIPARALGGDVEVTLATDDISGYPPLANARPDVLRIDPEGTVLEVPATVTIHPELVGASEGDRVTVAQLAPAGADAGWLFVESERDLATGGVTASVLRFGRGARRGNALMGRRYARGERTRPALLPRCRAGDRRNRSRGTLLVFGPRAGTVRRRRSL